jgi:hypothetical protein
MATPLKFTPRVVSQGSVSKPAPQPKPRFQGALLPTPSFQYPSKLARKK